MKCPSCTDGLSVAILCGPGCTLAAVRCQDCDGTGAIAESALARKAEGEKLRQDRINRGKSLREEAQDLGITATELSRRERGRV
ncbi:MAG: helix-turn-helix transcriptional regulator [Deltaproteobacteria bacterium]|nr:helix-turn-helix transcriptional regulator [Deltaproteobacteria bacterium]